MTGRQNLRMGYTTGACAAAAAKAATIALLRQSAVAQIEIGLPAGKRVSFQVSNCSFDENSASCSIVKDAGDDPDVTDGAEIYASVAWQNKSGIEITGGKGVGVVTKPGLEVAVGRPAINPVPEQMIRESVAGAAGTLNGNGLAVIISVPRGEALSKKTLNPRLGILGGISILGTTGLVIPYSVNAYTACISQSLDVAIATGCREVVLTTGRRSEKFAQAEFKLAEECFIQAGDFIGYSLEECARKGIAKVRVWGMIGKISKLAVGHMYTNVSDSLIDITFLSEVAKSSGLPDTISANLKDAVTANHFRKLLPSEYATAFGNRLCELAAHKCRETAGGKLEVECIMSDPAGAILGRAHASG